MQDRTISPELNKLLEQLKDCTQYVLRTRDLVQKIYQQGKSDGWSDLAMKYLIRSWLRGIDSLPILFQQFPIQSNPLREPLWCRQKRLSKWLK